MEYIRSYTFTADETITAYQLYLYQKWTGDVKRRMKYYHWSLGLVELSDPFYMFDNWPEIPKDIERFMKANIGKKPPFPFTGWMKWKHLLGLNEL